MSSQQNKPSSIQCKNCKVYGLEWKKDGEKYQLIWKYDKQPHTKDECQGIQNRSSGYGFNEVIARHKANNPKSPPPQQQDYQSPPPQAQPQQQTQLPQSSNQVTSLDKSQLAKIEALANTLNQKYTSFELSYITDRNEIKDHLLQIKSMIHDIREIMHFIPEVKEALEKNVSDSFQSAKDIHISNEDTTEEIQEEVVH